MSVSSVGSGYKLKCFEHFFNCCPCCARLLIIFSHWKQRISNAFCAGCNYVVAIPSMRKIQTVISLIKPILCVWKNSSSASIHISFCSPILCIVLFSCIHPRSFAASLAHCIYAKTTRNHITGKRTSFVCRLSTTTRQTLIIPKNGSQSIRSQFFHR